MRLADFDYTLSGDRIAQHPTSPRDAAKLLVVDRETGRFAHRTFRDLPEYLRPEDVLVINNTRVIPARLRARKLTGGAIEVVLLRPAPSAPGPRPSVPADDVWEVLLRPGRRAQVGTRLLFSDQLTGEVVSGAPGGTPVVRFSGSRRVLDVARAIGEIPIPPYVHEPLQRPDDYQTVYAAVDGAVAAPTAGLHFTEPLLHALNAQGVRTAYVTLHVGPGTFKPVTCADIRRHVMDPEWYELPAATAKLVNETRAAGGRIVAVGSTSVRVLETAAQKGWPLEAGTGETSLFIYPGFRFSVVDALLTNFHLPKSTLFMLVCALAGRERMLEAYRVAAAERYRFYSYGDAMLIG